MQEQINQLQIEINDLKAQVDLMRASGSFPYDIEQAIRDRIEPVSLLPSVKTAASETQAVNEGGSASYNVAKPMDGFEERSVDGVLRYYPYYT